MAAPGVTGNGGEARRRWLDGAWEAACEAIGACGGGAAWEGAIGGQGWRFEFATASLAERLGRALAHRERAAGPDPAHRVRVVDGAAAGRPMPERPPAELLRCGELLGWCDGVSYAHLDLFCGVLTVVDRERHRAVVWLRDGSRIHSWERASPFRTLLQAWLGPLGMAHVHSAGVALGDWAVLLPGASGAGKSSTALACLAGGLDFLGDDYCLVGGGPAPFVESLYCTAKTRPEDAARLGLGDDVPFEDYTATTGKRLYFLDTARAERMAGRARLRALLLPRVSGAPETRVTRAPGARALAAMAPGTALPWPAVAGPILDTLRAVVHAAPAYVLEAGTDRAQLAAAVRDVLEGRAP